jgi:hypothetical protein
MDIEDILTKIVNKNVAVTIQFAKVTAKSTSPNIVSIQLAGGTSTLAGIRYLSSYTPTVNDIVVCLMNKNDIFVIGTLA